MITTSTDTVRALVRAIDGTVPLGRTPVHPAGLAQALTALRASCQTEAGRGVVDAVAVAVADLLGDRDRAWARVAHLEAVIAAVRQEVGP